MGMAAWLLLLFLFPQAYSTPVDSEHDIPPYLRGMGWRNVEKELKKDLRLDPSIRPSSYDINMNVTVRGYGGATRSTFHGYVLIDLNATEPQDTIELHSVGLTIWTAELIQSSSVAVISKIGYNREKETVIFTLPQRLQPTDSTQLKVYYNGTAVMRGYGLFEYWTAPEKNPRVRPTISLVTNCEPQDARRWFPSFDEPDKKATFRLQVTHPTELTAYSNTDVDSNTVKEGTTTTTFHPTVPLPTYLVALSLTEQPAHEEEYKGQKISAIGPNRAQIVEDLKYSMDIVRNLPVLENVTFFPEKTAWLVVEDGIGGAMENPGLITSRSYGHSQIFQKHELLHMYFGNLVTLRSWEQLWINEGFADFYERDGNAEEMDADKRVEILDTIEAHEAAIHEKFSYTRSQFVTSHFTHNSHVHYSKAGQLIRLIKRLIGEKAFDIAINRYLIDNSFGNGDSEMMINYLSNEVPRVREIMEDWVYQKGRALLTVEEEHGQVIIEQRRFLRTDFYDELRDKKTRWTIPLFYTIDGVEHMDIMPRDVEKFVIKVPANSSFSIDISYPHCINSNDKLSQVIAQTEIMGYDRLPANNINGLVVQPTTGDTLMLWKNWGMRDVRVFCYMYVGDKSNEEIFDIYLIKNRPVYILCDSTLQNKEGAMRFLRDLLLTDVLPIRYDHVDEIKAKINNLYPGILIDLLAEEHSNAEFLDSYAWSSIVSTVSQDADGLEKIREIVRTNPSFAANLFYTITKIFENDFIKTERAKRQKSLEQENFPMKEQEAEMILI